MLTDPSLDVPSGGMPVGAVVVVGVATATPLKVLADFFLLLASEFTVMKIFLRESRLKP